MLATLLILWLVRSHRGIVRQQLRNAVSILAICAIIITCIPMTSLGGDAYQRGIGGTRFADARPKQESRTSQDTPTNMTPNENRREQLREGTLIPPTVGQFVLLGRRWAFVSAVQQPGSEDDLVTAEPEFRVPAANQDSRPRPTRLGTNTLTQVATSARYMPAALVRKNATVDGPVDLDQPHLVVVENLMLQRIVEAIRADASDDQWTVSGEATEFFKENRLLIHTAQRANSN